MSDGRLISPYGMKYLLGIAVFLVFSGCAHFKRTDTGCDRFSLRLDTMDRFCKGMATESAQAQCGDISDKKVLDECVSLITLKAIDQCFRLVSKSDIERLYKETCIAP